MESTLKEFFLSDMCEYNNLRKPSKEKAEALEKQEKTLELLKKYISGDDFLLFEEYTEACSIINDEDSYYAFKCVIKAALKILTEIFFGE